MTWTTIDAFPFHDELDILQMRLEELYDAVDWFILVEADVTHQDRPKPYHYAEHADRFAPWADKIIPVRATGLPSVADFPDPWAREHAQREWITAGLVDLENRGVTLPDDTVIMQSDVDEIPRAVVARNVNPGGRIWSLGQRGHFWAVDWFYPDVWKGTTITTLRGVARFGDRPWIKMRDGRNVYDTPAHLMDAGWHFSWLGGPDRALHKVGAFCHPEVRDRILAGINDELRFWRDGVHVDGKVMEPVEVDEGWPAFIREQRCPSSWWRPRMPGDSVQTAQEATA